MKLGAALFAGAVVAILIAERVAPRRSKRNFARSHEDAKGISREAHFALPKENERFARGQDHALRVFVASCDKSPSSFRRLARNGAMGVMALAVIEAVERPMVEALTRRFQRKGIGNQIAAFLILDYTMYLWHVATHARPLWRLHRIHHLDRALDASTALRFHMIDMVASLPLRAGQAVVSRASPATFELWKRFFFLSVLFHHSNLRLPPDFERRLAWALTTPAMHDIHHEATADRTGSNWSSGLSIWDRLHGTFRLDLDLALPIGAPGEAGFDPPLEALIRLPLEEPPP